MPDDKRKQSLCLPEEMLKEIVAEAERQDRSLSWIVQHAWKHARAKIASLPAGRTNPPAAEEARRVEHGEAAP